MMVYSLCLSKTEHHEQSAVVGSAQRIFTAHVFINVKMTYCRSKTVQSAFVLFFLNHQGIPALFALKLNLNLIWAMQELLDLRSICLIR